MIKTIALLLAATAAVSVIPPASAQAAPAAPAPALSKNPAACPAVLKHSFKRLQDEAPQDLCQYAGKVVLVVNTASYCGFTKQYEGLEKMYAKYGSRGLVILGFPSNDFGQQEPGNAKEIADLCYNTYGVKFPMFAKTSVKGAGRQPAARAADQGNGQGTEVELHQVPDRARRQGARVFPEQGHAGRPATGRYDRKSPVTLLTAWSF